jgi:hypothetical protein
MSSPARVKVYGLLRLTRRAYLTVQVVGLLVGVAALTLGLYLPRQKPEDGEPLLPFVRFFNLFLDLLPWIVLLLLILMAVETYVVLKKFDRLAVGPAVPDTGTSGAAGSNTNPSGTAGPTNK